MTLDRAAFVVSELWGLVRTMPRVTVTQMLYEAMLAMDWVSRHEFMKNLWRLASVAIC